MNHRHILEDNVLQSLLGTIALFWLTLFSLLPLLAGLSDGASRWPYAVLSTGMATLTVLMFRQLTRDVKALRDYRS